MEKIIMLGTGAGNVMNIYNACFLLENGKENLLVDTGGSIEIVKRLQEKGYDLANINNIFISHCHTDHILGLIWIFRKVAMGYVTGKYKEKINVYCNEEVTNSLNKLFDAVFQKDMQDVIKENVNIYTLHDEETIEVAGEKITFFDAHAKGNLLYGFETVLNNGKKLIFLGDETCNPILYDRLKDSDYVMHEVFCIDSEEGIPEVVKAHHSTVKKVCERMNPLNIKNLILFHTEDSHKNRKELYLNEAKEYFNNNVLVPDDLEEIEL